MSYRAGVGVGESMRALGIEPGEPQVICDACASGEAICSELECDSGAALETGFEPPTISGLTVKGFLFALVTVRAMVNDSGMSLMLNATIKRMAASAQSGMCTAYGARKTITATPRRFHSISYKNVG